MKKILILLALTVGISSTAVYAQGEQRDPAAMAQRMKERVKPQLVQKVQLTEAQADQVIEINLDVRSQMRQLRDLSPAERRTKAADIDAVRDKRYKAIPLNDEQVKAVNAFFEELRQEARQNRNQQ